MPLFIDADRNLVILANYKVMYSTFRKHEHLIRTGDKQVFKYLVKMNLLTKKPTVIMVVRNPYDRLLSFYREKILAAQYAHSSSSKIVRNKLQQCHEILIPFLNIGSNTSKGRILAEIRQVSFDQFVEMLEKVYMLDLHLAPQHLRRHLNFKLFGFDVSARLRRVKFLKIESPDDLRLLARYGIDTSVRENSTPGTVLRSDALCDHHYDIINKIYRQDFREFGYEMMA